MIYKLKTQHEKQQTLICTNIFAKLTSFCALFVIVAGLYVLLPDRSLNRFECK